jgi:hypothetical protein
MNWLLKLLRRIEPVTFNEDGMMRLRMLATSHTEVPKAPRFEIHNPRLELLKRKKSRSNARQG